MLAHCATYMCSCATHIVYTDFPLHSSASICIVFMIRFCTSCKTSIVPCILVPLSLPLPGSIYILIAHRLPALVHYGGCSLFPSSTQSPYMMYFCPFFFFLSTQLRVVRAFKSTLEDLEEKHSIHSFHSLHSIRSSRSHQGHPRLCDELSQPIMDAAGPKAPSPEQNGSYTNMALTIRENTVHEYRKMSTKSRSAENVSLVERQHSPPSVVIQAATPNASPRSYSSANSLQLRMHETTI